MANTLKKLVLENAVEKLIESGTINPENPDTFEKASKKIVTAFGKLHEKEIIRIIRRMCGASKPVKSTRPSGKIPWRPNQK